MTSTENSTLTEAGKTVSDAEIKKAAEEVQPRDTRPTALGGTTSTPPKVSRPDNDAAKRDASETRKTTNLRHADAAKAGPRNKGETPKRVSAKVQKEHDEAEARKAAREAKEAARPRFPGSYNISLAGTGDDVQVEKLRKAWEEFVLAIRDAGYTTGGVLSGQVTDTRDPITTEIIPGAILHDQAGDVLTEKERKAAEA